LQELVADSLRRIRADFSQLAPRSAGAVDAWIDRQGGDTSPEAAFRGLKAHFLLIPWFLEIRIRGEVDLAFERDLVYSSINAYYFVRLLDNVGDDHSPGDRSLLPLSALFHTNFQSVYSAWFEPASPFWDYFRRTWIGMADATVQNSQIADFSESDFVSVSAQ